MRRAKKADDKRLKADILKAQTLVDAARQLGVEVSDLELWQAKDHVETENKLRREIEAEYEQMDRKRKEAIEKEFMHQVDEANKKLVKILDEEREELRRDITEQCMKQFRDILSRTNELICLVNILLSCDCIHETWGYKKAINDKFLANWETCRKRMEKLKLRKMLERVNGFGCEFEFEDAEIFDIIEMCEKMDVSGLLAIQQKEAS
jgi:hypothetical protein